MVLDQPAGRLETAESRHADVHEYQVRALMRVPSEDLLAAGGGIDTIDAGDAGNELPESFTNDPMVVADQDGGGHGEAFGR
ncbi:MAG: hypothetical protein NVS3B26_05690 [Mycobacteriales bacterium]